MAIDEGGSVSWTDAITSTMPDAYLWNGPVRNVPTTTVTPNINTFLPGGGMISNPNVGIGIVTPFSNPFEIYAAPGKLTPAQLDHLLRHHEFIAMDGSDYCLFCYALDRFRGHADHIFVIHEE